jgi:hypothetical protein
MIKAARFINWSNMVNELLIVNINDQKKAPLLAGLELVLSH